MDNKKDNKRLFWHVALGWLAADLITKALVAYLVPVAYVPHEIVGQLVRVTLVYNAGAAMGINFGIWSRLIFALLSVGVLAIMAGMYKTTPPEHRLRFLALGFLAGGASGNLVNRIFWSQGVIDFMDVGARGHRFFTFNVADIAVTCGAFLLAYVLLGEDRARGPEEEPPNYQWVE